MVIWEYELVFIRIRVGHGHGPELQGEDIK